MEGHLASDDYGKDLTNVQNLQKKHALLEADVAAHQVQALDADVGLWARERERLISQGQPVRGWGMKCVDALENRGCTTWLLFRLVCLPLELPGSPKWGKGGWKRTPERGEMTMCIFLV